MVECRDPCRHGVVLITPEEADQFREPGMLQEEVQRPGVDLLRIEQLCRFIGEAQFLDLVVFPVRDVRLAQEEVR